MTPFLYWYVNFVGFENFAIFNFWDFLYQTKVKRKSFFGNTGTLLQIHFFHFCLQTFLNIPLLQVCQTWWTDSKGAILASISLLTNCMTSSACEWKVCQVLTENVYNNSNNIVFLVTVSPGAWILKTWIVDFTMLTADVASLVAQHQKNSTIIFVQLRI